MYVIFGSPSNAIANTAYWYLHLHWRFPKIECRSVAVFLSTGAVVYLDFRVAIDQKLPRAVFVT